MLTHGMAFVLFEIEASLDTPFVTKTLAWLTSLLVNSSVVEMIWNQRTLNALLS